jgi:hypothetical protein
MTHHAEVEAAGWILLGAPLALDGPVMSILAG